MTLCHMRAAAPSRCRVLPLAHRGAAADRAEQATQAGEAQAVQEKLAALELATHERFDQLETLLCGRERRTNHLHGRNV